MLETLRQRSKTLGSEVERLRGRQQAADEAAAKSATALATVTEDVELFGRECDALRTIGELLRENVKAKVERLVTTALRSIYGREDYEFVLEFELQRGQMTATPMLRSRFREDVITVPVQDAHGGGIVNVVAFVLRVVVLVLTRPALQRVIVADESFRNVSREYLPRVADFLRSLHDITGVQVVMVTHQPEMIEAADRVYRVTKDGAGVTVVREEGGGDDSNS